MVESSKKPDLVKRYAYETAGKRLWRTLQPEALRMRGEPTAAEIVLWEALRDKKLGVRFRRQHAIDRFIVDFVCLPAKLIVELDGGSHDGLEGRDQERDAILKSAGFRVLRFPNEQVLKDVSPLLRTIRISLDASG